MRSADAPGTWDADEIHETPETARARVKRLANELTRAELDVKRRREDELNAETARDQAKAQYEAGQTAAQLSPSAPSVERGGSTVADKAAWVEQATAKLKDAHLDAIAVWKAAKLQREAAQDHYRRVDTQASLAQSILKSIDGTFMRALSDRSEP